MNKIPDNLVIYFGTRFIHALSLEKAIVNRMLVRDRQSNEEFIFMGSYYAYRLSNLDGTFITYSFSSRELVPNLFDPATFGIAHQIISDLYKEPTLYIKPEFFPTVGHLYYVERACNTENEWLHENGEWGCSDSPVIYPRSKEETLVMAAEAYKVKQLCHSK